MRETNVSKVRRLCSTLFAAFALAAGCQRQPPAPAPAGPPVADSPITNYMARGVVKEMPQGGTSVVIHHEAIPGYMAAMTMPFPVKDPAELHGIKTGDAVEFRVRVTARDGWIDQIRLRTNAPAAAPPVAAVPEVPSTPGGVNILPNVPELAPGDPLPSYTLTNQLGAVVATDQFRGKVLAMTFIFTRCPFPTFCLRMTQHFDAVQESLKGRPEFKNWHLLTISFDPAYDTPEKLAEYGRIHKQDPAWWTMATGSWDQVDRITGAFGLYFSRGVAPQDQNHKLRTVVVNPAGKVHRIFMGNEWTPEELARSMIEAAAAK